MDCYESTTAGLLSFGVDDRGLRFGLRAGFVVCGKEIV
jgi:hypothetical protein